MNLRSDKAVVKDSYRGRYAHKKKHEEQEKMALGVRSECADFPEKRQFKSEAKAQVLADHLQRLQPHSFVHAYYCAACNYWHVGRLANRTGDSESAE